ncbi:MAG: NAD(P)/FAD-dependent oxidoreductase [Planctomycetaceae bacterium]
MRVVIVGAGFAGVATAYHLARRGVREVLLLEREPGPGMHASGRNAGILRQSSEDPAIAAFLRAGSRAARRYLRSIPGSLRRAGTLVMGSRIRRLCAGPRARISPASSLIPGLQGLGLYDPEDALADPLSFLNLLQKRAERAGVVFRFGAEVIGVARKGGGVIGVITRDGAVSASTVVVAAGAWSSGLGAIAGSRLPHLQPLRRHLFRGRLDGATPALWPAVWDEDAGVYFRPEGEELLLSPCDESPHAAREPSIDLAVRDRLAAKLVRASGGAGRWRIGRGWASLRTFPADRRFVIGPDPEVLGLFWVAGLGGHGFTAAWAVGRHAARVLLQRTPPGGAFDPCRFAREAPAPSTTGAA